MKFRIIPTILTDGTTVVKGSQFNNWRTVGTAQAAARLFGARDVDELIFLDVTARSRGATIDLELIKQFSEVLTVPFSVGGGINTLEQASECFRAGAEKIIFGTSAVKNNVLIEEVASKFGKQAVVVTIDMTDKSENEFYIESGSERIFADPLEFAIEIVSKGAGEIILQCKDNDGTQRGLCLKHARRFLESLDCPVILSGGVSTENDFVDAYNLGASGVAAGSIFQFTHLTPDLIRNHLATNGIPVRTI